VLRSSVGLAVVVLLCMIGLAGLVLVVLFAHGSADSSPGGELLWRQPSTPAAGLASFPLRGRRRLTYAAASLLSFHRGPATVLGLWGASVLVTWDRRAFLSVSSRPAGRAANAKFQRPEASRPAVSLVR
jgi:hypothetical protein